jgi:exopolysaccharide biosynthesis operon protein EpsL
MTPSRFHALRPLALLSGALIISPAGLAAAQQQEQEQGLRLYGGIGWGYDDNLLRVPDKLAAFGGRRSDHWRQAQVGALYDQHLGRQRVALVAKASRVRFDHFRQLDYTGRDLKATWFWQAGNRIEGQAGALHERTLASYLDFFSDQRNVRERRRQWVDALWQMHPGWKLGSGFTRERYEYELPSQRFNNRTEKAAQLELLHTPRSGSTVGLQARQVRGWYPLWRPASAGAPPDDFPQDELKLRIDWHATGSTSLQALAGYVRREQPSFGAGATSGFNGRISASYEPRGKLTYHAALWREFAPIESTIVSTTLNRGASVGVSWAASGKIKVDAGATYEQRAFKPRALPNPAFSGPGDLDDSLRSASLRATWQARRTLQLSAGWQHQARSGSGALGLGRLDANTVTVNANLLF